jgi:hypothetical protein
MYDATVPGNIRASAAMVAWYGDGLYAWSQADLDRFADAVKVRITVFADDDEGQVLDVENGDATPVEAPGWAQRRRAAGQDPTVYCNASTWPQVRAEFALAKVAEPHWWIAEYDGRPEVPAGAVAKQYLGGPTALFDVSAVADYWPGVDPAPKPAPAPEEAMANGMITGKAGSKQDIVCPMGKRPDLITFGCSEAARLSVDTRVKGTADVEVDLSYVETKPVEWPKGIDMIVVHVVEAAADGTPISWAY